MGSKAEHLTDFAERRQGKKKINEIDLQACFFILLFRMCYLIKKKGGGARNQQRRLEDLET